MPTTIDRLTAALSEATSFISTVKDVRLRANSHPWSGLIERCESALREARASRATLPETHEKKLTVESASDGTIERAYVRVRETDKVKTAEYERGVIHVDYDGKGKICGVEFFKPKSIAQGRPEKSHEQEAASTL